MFKRILTLATVAFACLSGVAGSAIAASSDWAKTDFTSVRLISAVDGTAALDEIPLGLEFKLDEGWKIYWRNPGDAGLPPTPDWSASENVSDVTIDWPAPHRFSIFGLETFGYKDHVVLPLRVKPTTPGQPVTLTGAVNYLACSEICVPLDVNVSLNLPAGQAGVADEAPLINRFDSTVPRPANSAGITLQKAGFTEADDDQFALRVAALSQTTFDAPDLIVEGPAGSYFDKPQVTLSDDGRQVYFDLKGGGVATDDLDQAPLTLTLLDTNNAVEGSLQATEGLADIEPSGGLNITALLPILGLALLGGLILNLMPCVLPVLSMKLLSVVSHGGSHKKDVRRGFLASAAGILTAFLILAGSLAALKQAGVVIGWGIQFQQPVFLATMIVVVTLFAANLLGFFQIRLPDAVSDIAANAGHGKQGLTGHFVTGIFATVLATPCSAPFLGTAIGFALSQGTTEIFAVFIALGIGLAAPYLLVALFPGVAAAMPRPGAWMNKLRAVLSLALIGTGIWLLTVLDSIAGRDITISVGALSVLILAVFATRRLTPKARVARFAPVAAAILSLATVALPITKDTVRPIKAEPLVTDTAWIPFDESAIPALVASGKTVFVDVTADWCITCQFNKKTVVEVGQVAEWLQRDDVVAMRADWTRPSDEISHYLNKFGRYGIPFNVIYGPDAPQGVPLPELLTTDDVLAAAAKANGKTAVAQD